MKPSPSGCRRRSAAGGAAAGAGAGGALSGIAPVGCPRAALYILPTLPAIRSAAAFHAVSAQYSAAVRGLAPAGEQQYRRATLPSCAGLHACRQAPTGMPINLQLT